MISLYSAAVMTTAMIGGLALYSMQESKVTPTFALDSEAIYQAHYYAEKRSRAAFPPTKDMDTAQKIGLGPFFDTDKAKSYVIHEYSPFALEKNSYQVTWMEISPDKQNEARRLAGRITPGERMVVGIMGDSGTSLNGHYLPAVPENIPVGSIVVLTEQVWGTHGDEKDDSGPVN